VRVSSGSACTCDVPLVSLENLSVRHLTLIPKPEMTHSGGRAFRLDLRSLLSLPSPPERHRRPSRADRGVARAFVETTRPGGEGGRNRRWERPGGPRRLQTSPGLDGVAGAERFQPPKLGQEQHDLMERGSGMSLEALPISSNGSVDLVGAGGHALERASVSWPGRASPSRAPALPSDWRGNQRSVSPSCCASCLASA
jgi:hypothetical protein